MPKRETWPPRDPPSREFFRKDFATRWLDLHTPQAWTNRALEELERALHDWVVEPAGTEGYEKAEVTVGGVDTSELSSKSMESRRVPGLFFIGEVVDVTGQLGGFNFQWAWASGAAAGRSHCGAGVGAPAIAPNLHRLLNSSQKLIQFLGLEPAYLNANPPRCHPSYRGRTIWQR